MTLQDNKIGTALYRFWDTKMHFLELHYLYILLLTFVISGLFYCKPGTNWNYIDALFMATTGTTNTGLNTISMSEMSTYHMVILYFAAFLGNHVLISFYVLMVRRFYFSKRFEDVLAANKKKKEEYKLKRQQEGGILQPIRRRLSLISSHSTTKVNSPRFSMFKRDRQDSSTSHVTKNSQVQSKEFSSIEMDNDAFEFSQQNDEPEHPISQRTSGISPFDQNTTDEKSEEDGSDIGQDKGIESPTIPNTQQITFREDTNVLRERERRRFQRKANHRSETELIPMYRTNSEYEIMSKPVAKSELTRNERFRMGGKEYCALDMLGRIVPIYYLGFILFFGFLFRIYIASSVYAQTVLETSNANGPVEPWFFSFFLSISAFTNLGLNHLDASMSPFQNAPCPLILCIILILVGNTAFAIALRFIIWACYQLTPDMVATDHLGYYHPGRTH
ncbi:hypothetical protein G6F56_010308 [Rhizopus delemar]|nr:hypothetical protein G6F56_010308 [Rhizopus delemar]